MSGSFFFWLGFGLVLSFLPLSLCLLVMHVLMPQAVLDRYWKEPHFRSFELMLFSGWSFFAPMRTIMFMWTFMFPRLGQKRGIVEPHRLVPRWYRIASIVLCVWSVVILVGAFAIFFGFLVYFYIIGKPISWDVYVALGTTVLGFGFLALRHWWLNRHKPANPRTKAGGRDRRKSV